MWRQRTVPVRRRRRRKREDRSGPSTWPHRELSTVTVKVMSLTQVLNQTQGIVFLALQDLEKNLGDSSCCKSKHFQSDVDSRNKGRTSGIKPGLSSCASDQCQQCPECDEAQPRISYSVSYFNWSVSSSEDECENVTLRLDRLKIRRTSKERNGSLSHR